jgi:hypothetical protein
MFALLSATLSCSDPDRVFAACEIDQVEIDGVCRATCTTTCPVGETCSDGACLPCDEAAGCPSCGDGLVTGSEACDDGNAEPGDGCERCKIEDNWACDDAAPSACSCVAGYQDNDRDGTCNVDCDNAALDCGARGACNDSSGSALCDCDRGYQDNDHALGCRPDCETAALQCGQHSSCSDASGTAECACDDGFQDNDHNGACSEGCNLLVCGDHASCSDSRGNASCSCDDGFQDNDADGACLVDCSEVSCDANSSCDDSSGTASCVCTNGYQDLDDNGKCEQSCSKIDCGAHGSCDDSTGIAQCSCGAGYQDNDDENGCAPDCKTAAPNCGPNAHCDDGSGQARCQCNAGYQDNDGKNGCAPNCAQAALGCGAHASCDDSSGTAACACEPHYLDPGKDGTCEQGTCYVTSSVCGATKYCERENDACVALPEVPNSDFSCQSGGNCALGWTLTQGFTIGNDCGGGLTATRSAFVQPSPGVYGDFYARVTIPIPSYAGIDPPSDSAGPFAIAFDTGQFCAPGASGPACPTQSQPGPEVVASLDGVAIQRFKPGNTANCSLARRIGCLGQSAYGHDALLQLRPAAQMPSDPPIPLWLITFTQISLVRDASCPVPGVIPFDPGDFGGAVTGTQNSPYLDLSFASGCAPTSAKTDVSVPITPKSVIKLELTATADAGGIYPRLDVNMSRPDGLTMTLGSSTANSTDPTELRFCVEHSFFGEINELELKGTPEGNDCSAATPLLRVRQLSMVPANAGECP